MNSKVWSSRGVESEIWLGGFAGQLLNPWTSVVREGRRGWWQVYSSFIRKMPSAVVDTDAHYEHQTCQKFKPEEYLWLVAWHGPAWSRRREYDVVGCWELEANWTRSLSVSIWCFRYSICRVTRIWKSSSCWTSIGSETTDRCIKWGRW